MRAALAQIPTSWRTTHAVVVVTAMGLATTLAAVIVSPAGGLVVVAAIRAVAGLIAQLPMTGGGSGPEVS